MRRITIHVTVLAVFVIVLASILESASAQGEPSRIYLPALDKLVRLTFGTGQHIVGVDILPGTYRTRTASQGCYWERLRGFSGAFSDVIANESNNGPTVATIAINDRGFKSNQCATWTNDLSPITVHPSASLSAGGTYIVNVDIAPGLWRADNVEGCYWERLRGFGGSFQDVIANGTVTGSALVQISPADKGFSTYRCGTWNRLSD